MSPETAPEGAPEPSFPPQDQPFLRDLVKTSRQKIHHVNWVDRDGVARQTALNQPEVVRLNTIASRIGVSKSEVLRRAAYIPAEKTAKPPGEGLGFPPPAAT